MSASATSGAFQLVDLDAWREAQAVDQAQDELEDRAQTILWAIGFAHAFLFVGTMIAVVFA